MLCSSRPLSFKDILCAFNAAIHSELADDLDRYWSDYCGELQNRAKEKEQQLSAALQKLK